jgi:hypothetical protein
MFLEIFTLLCLGIIVFLIVPKIKNKTHKFSFAIISTVFFTTAFAYAQTPAPVEPPVWLGDLLTFIASIPSVGPIVVEVFKWLGVVASVFTALSVAVSVIVKIPELAARFAGLPEIAEKLNKINEKVQPYLKYLSIFNVQKK